MAGLSGAERFGTESQREVFKTGALNHSATLPRLQYQILSNGAGENKARTKGMLGTRLAPDLLPKSFRAGRLRE
jgi:hypothetical protein